MTSSPDVTVCSVCRQAEAEPRNIQACYECGEPFHLNPRNDQPGIDCGDAWIGESFGLEYYCQPCIDRLQAQSMGTYVDPAMARHADLMQTIAPSYPGAPPAPTLAPGRAQAPPKRERPRVRRRYRRVDQ